MSVPAVSSNCSDPRTDHAPDGWRRRIASILARQLCVAESPQLERVADEVWCRAILAGRPLTDPIAVVRRGCASSRSRRQQLRLTSALSLGDLSWTRRDPQTRIDTTAAQVLSAAVSENQLGAAGAVGGAVRLAQAPAQAPTSTAGTQKATCPIHIPVEKRSRATSKAPGGVRGGSASSM